MKEMQNTENISRFSYARAAKYGLSAGAVLAIISFFGVHFVYPTGYIEETGSGHVYHVPPDNPDSEEPLTVVVDRGFLVVDRAPVVHYATAILVFVISATIVGIKAGYQPVTKNNVENEKSI